MKNSKYTLNSQAFNFAWLVISFFGGCFSKALKTGWIIAKSKSGQKVTVYFEKVNKKTGELTTRKANILFFGSTKTIEKGYIKFKEDLNGVEQWRSFRFERLIFDKKKQRAIDNGLSNKVIKMPLRAKKAA